MDELTREQEEAVAATVGAIQRIAMAIVELPTEGRAAHYAMVRRKFEAVMMEVGIEGATAHAWLNSTMHGIQSLVSEIEAGGGAWVGRLRASHGQPAIRCLCEHQTTSVMSANGTLLLWSQRQ